MIWDTLGIDKTTDIKKIKSAYSTLAKQYNPEEYPDKFMEIHNAYKKACEYAKNNKTLEPEMNQSKIVIENNIIAFICYNIINCSIHFCTGTEIKKVIVNKTEKNESDFDFSNLKVFSQHNNTSKIQTLEEIQKIILEDMNTIVNDKDLINSFYIWENFLNNKIVIDTISNQKNTDRLDSILNHKRFAKEIAELVSRSIGNKTKIIRNTDFGFYYIDVTGKRKLYYYLTSSASRKRKFYYNLFWFIIILIILLLILIGDY